MVLPKSGALDLLQIVSEFGGSLPHNLTEYYRGAGYVPSFNTDVPASGTIWLTDFYGSSLVDLTPQANLGFAVNYTGTSPVSTGVKTVSGLGAGVTINVTITQFKYGDSSFVSFKKNGAIVASPITLTNGDTLEAIGTCFTGTAGVDVQFINNSNNDEIIGAFTMSITGGGLGGL